MVDDPQSANSDSPFSDTPDDGFADELDAGFEGGGDAPRFRGPGGGDVGGGGARGGDPGGTPGGDASPFDALAGGGALSAEMARLWIRENLSASMIGAFAVGVFTGAMLRD